MADEETSGKKAGAADAGKKKLIIIIAAVVAVVVLGLVALLLFSGGEEEEEAEAEVEEVVEDTTPLAAPSFLELGTYAVLLKDGKHNFRVTLQLMISEPPAKFYLATRMPLVKDILLSVLPRYTAKQLYTEEGRDQLRADVISEMNTLFPKEPGWDDPRTIRKVLFEEFVITTSFSK